MDVTNDWQPTRLIAGVGLLVVLLLLLVTCGVAK